MKPMLASSVLEPSLTDTLPHPNVWDGHTRLVHGGTSPPSTILQNYKMAAGQCAFYMYFNCKITASLVVIHSWNGRVSLVLTLFEGWHTTNQGLGGQNK